ncbi:MAG: hypothetical protein ACTSU2_17540 [Promethearchaeota archaeon]
MQNRKKFLFGLIKKYTIILDVKPKAKIWYGDIITGKEGKDILHKIFGEITQEDLIKLHEIRKKNIGEFKGYYINRIKNRDQKIDREWVYRIVQKEKEDHSRININYNKIISEYLKEDQYLSEKDFFRTRSVEFKYRDYFDPSKRPTPQDFKNAIDDLKEESLYYPKGDTKYVEINGRSTFSRKYFLKTEMIKLKKEYRELVKEYSPMSGKEKFQFLIDILEIKNEEIENYISSIKSQRRI